jgi:alpha-L-fucosidase
MASARSALARLRSRQVPAWWRDAKLGIFVHWTPASIPAYAPTAGDYGELLTSGRPDAFAYSPYVEWYENSLRFPRSPASRHHREVWGDRPYRSFAADFEAGLDCWDPDGWAASFAATGARYVVLVSKHADGWCLWPSRVPNPHLPGWHAGRDLVGELAAAVRGHGMRFGLYYSGGLDSTFREFPMGSMGGVLAAVPRGDYPAYAEAQVRELIDRYRPSVLWNDIAWPAPGRDLWPLLEDYYRVVPDGVVNDRWMPWSPLLSMARTARGRNLIDALSARQSRSDGGLVPPKPPHFGYRTPEYMTFDEIQRTPWECVRGMDHSFGYNAQSTEDDFLARDELLWSVTDIVAKGGNLLLNVGPRAVDARIPDEQLERLGWLAGYLPPNGHAVFGTRPWSTPGTTTVEGDPLRYTARDDEVFAFVRSDGSSATLAEPVPTASTTVRGVDGRGLEWSVDAAGLRVAVPPSPEGDPVVVVLEHVEARSRR